MNILHFDLFLFYLLSYLIITHNIKWIETKNLQIPPTDRLLGAARPVVKIHNVAWGTEYPFYASISRNFDSYMYNNPDFLIVTAVGNKDHIGSAISDPATSKNSLVGEFDENVCEDDHR